MYVHIHNYGDRVWSRYRYGKKSAYRSNTNWQLYEVITVVAGIVV